MLNALISWVGKTPWRRERLPTPVFWPGESHGLNSPWGHKESDMTERLSHFHWVKTHAWVFWVLLCLRWVFTAAHGLSLVAVSGRDSSWGYVGFSLQWPLLLWSTAWWSWSTGLVSPRHVGSSQTRDRTCGPCTGQHVLNHWTVREVQNMLSRKKEGRKEKKKGTCLL